METHEKAWKNEEMVLELTLVCHLFFSLFGKALGTRPNLEKFAEKCAG